MTPRATRLGERSEAHPVVGHVEDGVVGPEEDISEDPQWLAILGGHVGGLESQHALAVCLLNTEREYLFICTGVTWARSLALSSWQRHGGPPRLYMSRVMVGLYP